LERTNDALTNLIIEVKVSAKKNSKKTGLKTGRGSIPTAFFGLDLI